MPEEKKRLSVLGGLSVKKGLSSDRLMAKVKDLQISNEQLSEEYTDMKRELEQVKHLNVRLKNELEKVKDEAQIDLQLMREEFVTEGLDLQHKLKELQLENERLVDEIKVYRFYEVENRELCFKIQQMKKALSQYQEIDLSVGKKSLDELKNWKLKLENEYTLKDLDNKEKAYMDLDEASRTAITENEQMKEAIKSENESLESLLINFQSMNEKLQYDHSLKSGRLQKTKEQLSLVENQLSQQRQRNEEIEIQLQSIKRENQSQTILKSEIELKDTRILLLEDEVASLQKELTKLKKRRRKTPKSGRSTNLGFTKSKLQNTDVLSIWNSTFVPPSDPGSPSSSYSETDDETESVFSERKATLVYDNEEDDQNLSFDVTKEEIRPKRKAKVSIERERQDQGLSVLNRGSRGSRLQSMQVPIVAPSVGKSFMQINSLNPEKKTQSKFPRYILP